MRLPLPRILTALALLACVACSATGPTTHEPSASISPASAPTNVAVPTWGPCPEGFVSECTTLEAPLDHDHAEETGKVELFVAHYPAAQGGGPALWLLEGGPGGSGADFAGVIPMLAKEAPTLDIYTLDHRGVGKSSPLRCPDQEAITSPGGAEVTEGEWDACILHLKRTPGLAQYNVTQAAHDLSFAIRATHRQDQPVIVYGVSYGTYWLNRYLQLHPDEPTAAVMDSTMVPTHRLGPESDLQADPVAKQWFDRCANDALCSSKLGASPWSTLGRVYTKLAAGHCPSLGITTQLLRQTLTTLFDGRDERVLSLALIHRIDRCSTDDVNAISHFYERIFGTSSLRGYSVALQNHVVLSELWPTTTATRAELESAVDKTYFRSGYAPNAVDLYPKWPRYVPDALALKWHESPRPVLLLAGTIDVRTPYSTTSELAGHGTLVTFPGEGHGTLVQSRVKDPTRPPCGLSIVAKFAASGGATIDTSCVGDLAPLSFTFPAAVAQDIFGRSDIWD